ncbi:MAG: helix-turn-helix domain-containing protein [Muribaculaceae bacterium]|nr:helix-turn-helix domain-containing protein [Muribaculaceae bacterium]
MKSIYKKDYQQLLDMLKSYRLERGVTQEQLASRLGVNQAIISKIETHERRLDVIELREICVAIGISFSDFIIQLDKNLTVDPK